MDPANAEVFPLAEAKRDARSRRRSLLRAAAALGFIALSGAIIWYYIDPGRAFARLRGQFIAASETALRRDLAEADAIRGNLRKRENLRETARTIHRERLSRVDDLVQTFSCLAAAPGNTGVLSEFLRVRGKQGNADALRFLDARRADILDKAATSTGDSRRELEPLLRAAQIALSEGGYDPAESLFRDLVRSPHFWPQAQHEFIRFLVDIKGPRAVSNGTFNEARAIYEEGRRHAGRLAGDEPEIGLWQCDLSACHARLGQLATMRHVPEQAIRHHAASLVIREKLVAAEPGNPQWQRDLADSHERLGDLALLGNWEEAARHFAASLVVRKKLATADSGNSQWQGELSCAHLRLATVATLQRDLEAADRHRTMGLSIMVKLAAADPGNTEWQHSLFMSYSNLGYEAGERKDSDEANRFYADALAIAEKLAAADPGNTQWQRDAFEIHTKLAKLADSRVLLKESALRYAACVAIAEKVNASDPGDTEWRHRLTASHDSLGGLAVRQLDLDEAARHYGVGLAVREKFAAMDPDSVDMQCELVASHFRLARITKERDSRQHFQQARDILEKLDRRKSELSPEERELIRKLESGFPASR